MKIDRVQEGMMPEPEYVITLSVREMLELVGVAYLATRALDEVFLGHTLQDSKVAGVWWEHLRRGVPIGDMERYLDAMAWSKYFIENGLKLSVLEPPR